MRYLKQWVSPPTFEDLEAGVIIRSLHFILSISMALFASLIPIGFMLGGVARERIPVVVALLIIAVSSYSLLKRGRIRLAGYLAISSLWLIAVITAIAYEGIYSASYNAVAIVTALAGLTLTLRWLVLFIGVNTGIGLAFVGLANQGILPYTDVVYPELIWISQLGLNTVIPFTAYYLRGIVQDTFRRASAAEALLRDVVNDQTEFIVRWDTNGNCTFANEAYCKLHKIKLADLVGTNLFSLMPGRVRDEVRNKLMSLTAEAPVAISDHPYTREDGTEGWHQWIDRVLFDPNGQRIGYQSVGRDVTTLRDYEEQRIELEMSQQRVTFLQDFLNSMSHDLKTPLSVIKSNIYLAQRSRTMEQNELRLGIIKDQSELLEKMINDIITVTRLNHLPQLQLVPLHIYDLTQEVCDVLITKAEAKNIQMDVVMHHEDIRVKADENELRRAMTNLIENAINYTPDHGKVIIEISSTGEYIEIQIQDTGIGIQQEELPRIFDQFYRASNARAIHGGTGLGLAIVKRIIDLHDGKIGINSEAGKGTTVSLQLPITITPAMA